MPEIYLLRHAEAVSHSDPRYRHDAERPLTEEGAAAMRRGALGMARLGLSFDLILTSPLVRARETAECVRIVFGAGVAFHVDEAMSSGTRWDKVRRALHAHASAESVLLVGHNPDLSSIAGELVGAGPSAILFGKGTLARIVVGAIPPKEHGSLRFLMSLDQLARAASGMRHDSARG